MPSREYLVDGDQGFIGLNSRDNPVNLGKNFVSKSQNYRMDRGVATPRKGVQRLTIGALVNETIFGSCTYTTSAGVELIVLVVGTGLYTYNPDTNAISVKRNFPTGQVITSSDDVDVYQAQGIGYVYILRGFSNTTLRWDGSSTIVVPGPTVHNNYPNSRHAIYYGNRHIVQTDSNTLSVSHYLSDSTWSALDMFNINDGGNDRLIAIAPWTLNEFVIFMRNSVFYANVGVGATVSGSAATDNNSYVKSLATDIGCIAKKAVVQAGGGIIFLSDTGVYIASPQGSAGQGAAGSPEGMRLLAMAEPLSAPVQDVIYRINYNAVDKAVAIYWENRYYLAVPLDNSTVNNSVLVYNFVNKSWESLDTYQPGFDIKAFAVAKRGNRRRLFAIDQEQGVFLMEELDFDNYDQGIGVPSLPFYLPFTLAPTEFFRYPIDSQLVTRAYTFETNREKRFSSLQSDISLQQGAALRTSLITTNPDTETPINSYGSGTEEDIILRLPVRKSGYSAQVKFTSDNLRPTVRSVTIQAIVPGQNTQTKK